MQGINISILRVTSSIKVPTRSSSVVTNTPTSDKEATTVTVQPTTQQVITSSLVVTDISSSLKESITVTVQATTPQPETSNDIFLFDKKKMVKCMNREEEYKNLIPFGGWIIGVGASFFSSSRGEVEWGARTSFLRKMLDVLRCVCAWATVCKKILKTKIWC